MKEIIYFFFIVKKIILFLIPLLISIAYLSFIERKIIGYMQSRIGPNRLGFFGILQPIADALKLFFKEPILPSLANKYLFLSAPLLSFIPSLAAWAVIPFSEKEVISNINAGILYLFSMTSLSIYGIIIAGWASNSKYALYGAMRAGAQVISYELAMGICLSGVMIASGSWNITKIVHMQSGGICHWYFIPLFPLFVIYWISGIAETNRAPFDVVEGESEIVGGCHVEYSGIRFAIFFLTEYANMILISALISLFFFGGWLSPFSNGFDFETKNSEIIGIIWMLLKISIFLFFYLWIRASFPRYRYDQIMRLGWKFFIPISLFWVILLSLAVRLNIHPWFSNL